MADDAYILREDVKRQLNITWSDTDTDKKVQTWIDGGIAYINSKIGSTYADFLVVGQPRSLLFDYCRYSRDDALEVFESNYLHLLLAAQLGKAVQP